MSETLRETVPAQADVPSIHQGNPWGHWRNQALAVMRLEMRKSFLGKRVFLLLVLALMPVFILALRWMLASELVHDPANLGRARRIAHRLRTTGRRATRTSTRLAGPPNRPRRPVVAIT